MKETNIRVHRFEPASQVNGPGLRAVLWVQGCALGCPGCFNPETHAFDQGQLQSPEMLFDQVVEASRQYAIEGLTISGGEPLHQFRALIPLLERVRKETGLSILVFSGYDWNEIHRFSGIDRFLANIDTLIAGRYVSSQRIANGLIGSANKTAYFITDRYSKKDLDDIPQAEVIITPDGQVILSGIDPLQW